MLLGPIAQAPLPRMTPRSGDRLYDLGFFRYLTLWMCRVLFVGVLMSSSGYAHVVLMSLYFVLRVCVHGCVQNPVFPLVQNQNERKQIKICLFRFSTFARHPYRRVSSLPAMHAVDANSSSSGQQHYLLRCLFVSVAVTSCLAPYRFQYSSVLPLYRRFIVTSVKTSPRVRRRSNLHEE